MASIAALLFYLIPGFENPALMIFLITFFIVIGPKIARKFEIQYGKDPSQFTLDEFIGMWITLLFLPKKIWYLVPAFLIWRLFDIIKLFPANKLESVKNGWGVLLDDIMAGTYSFIFIQVSIHLINHFTS